MSFAQIQGGATGRFGKVIEGMKKIVEASWVTSADRSEVGAFLQQKQAEDDGDTAIQAPAAYESKSGGILETIGDMEEKAEDSLGAERKEEMKDQNSYALLKMALENEMKSLKDELSKATSKKQFTTQELANAQKAMAASQKGLAEDSKYLADLKHECQMKATEYEEEYKDRQGELGALAKATEILSSKFSFLQTGVRTRTRLGTKLVK